MQPTVKNFRRKTFDQIVKEFGATSVYGKQLDFSRYFRVAKMDFGHIIETSYMDEFQVNVIETLVTYTGKKAFLCNREYEGQGDMWQKDHREQRFPVGCLVDLVSTKELARLEKCNLMK